MAQYPGLPDNRLIVGGKDISTAYGLVMIDGYELNPPEPKLYQVEVPGSDGYIDLTEALNGDVTYNNRKQKFTFYLINPINFEHTKTLISNYLHGRAFDYKISMDPEYTYHGRFSVSSYTQPSGDDSYSGQVAAIVIEIDAEPYKLKQHMTYRVNAVGGRMYTFYSGRKPVRPIIETRRPIRVEWGGQTIQLGIGTFRLNTVLFKEGANSLYINSLELFSVTWDWIQQEEHKMTWNEAGSKYRWDELQRLGISSQSESGSDISITAQSWSDFLPDWTSPNGINTYMVYGLFDDVDYSKAYYNPETNEYYGWFQGSYNPELSDNFMKQLFGNNYASINTKKLLSGDYKSIIEQNFDLIKSGAILMPINPAVIYYVGQLYQNYQSDVVARGQAGKTWNDLSDLTWNDLNYVPDSEDARTDISESSNIVYISYDWKDL